MMSTGDNTSENQEGLPVKALSIVDETDIFKVPVGIPKKKKKKVLNEDEFVQNVENIIERDFYPDLENLRDKLDYINAKETNNISKLQKLNAKYSSGTPLPQSSSPATFETPSIPQSPWDPQDDVLQSNPSSKTQSESTVSEPTNMENASQCEALDHFMITHTSEDDDSFDKLMEEQNKKLKLKYAWMYRAEEKHNATHVPNLALPTCEEQAEAIQLSITGSSNDSRPKEIENWTYETFNSVMYVPEGVPPSKEKLLELAKQKKREIKYSNTRFEDVPFKESLSLAAMQEASAIQASKLEGKIGVDGKELCRETPTVNGYSYVHAPSPHPGVDASPFMTWGEVEGTPFHLEGSQTPLLRRPSTGPAYHVPCIPDRDRIGHELAEKASQKHRDNKGKAHEVARNALSSPAASKFGSQSSMERIASMSPAAKRLLSSKFGVRMNTDNISRKWITPSPSLRNKMAFTPKSSILSPALSKLKRVSTPKTPSLTDDLLDFSKRKEPCTVPIIVEGINKGSLTDNLLELNEKQSECNRKCAADFF